MPMIRSCVPTHLGGINPSNSQETQRWLCRFFYELGVGGRRFDDPCFIGITKCFG